MLRPLTETRAFVPGTSGWTADDLDDPAIEGLWEAGSYQIIEGALVNMPAAYYAPSKSLARLVRIVERHLEDKGLEPNFSFEPDLILSPLRVVRPDAVYLSPADERRQRRANRLKGAGRQREMVYGRLLVPPTLIIENISLGHESEDREVKRRWYAEAKVPHYWILDAFARTLDCLVLHGRHYRVEQSARDDERVRPGLFKGLVIPLGELWSE